MHPILAVLVNLAAAATALLSAMDPRQENYQFTYRLNPPDGFSVTKSKAVMRADAKEPKAYALIGQDGRFTPVAQWYYAIGSDARSFATWWHGYFTDAQVWKPGQTPVWTGTTAGNQGHRIISWLRVLKAMVDADPEIDQAVKDALCNETWKRAAEQVVIGTIDARGMLAYGGNQADMACLFHFLRTKFGAIGLKIDTLYPIDRAQDLIASLLTLPWVIADEDRFVTPPNADYLTAIIRQAGGSSDRNQRRIQDGQVLWTGGMFIGWKDKPSLHGTWDGLAIINSLFKYHPDPDPTRATSIFHKWHRLPEAEQRIGRQAIALCSRRLWLDWEEERKPTWTWVRAGKPTEDVSAPSEAPFLPAYDGYGDQPQAMWAKSCWEEMFGDPTRNTNDGVQALLAIVKGGVHRQLKTPRGQQVPGRYDFEPAKQEARQAEDDGLQPKPASPSTPSTNR